MSEMTTRVPFDPIPVGGSSPLSTLDPPRPSFSRIVPPDPPTGGLLPPMRKPLPASAGLPAGIAPESSEPAVEPNPFPGTPPPNPKAVGGLLRDVFRITRGKTAVVAGLCSLFAGAYGLNLVMPAPAPSTTDKPETVTAAPKHPEPETTPATAPNSFVHLPLPAPSPLPAVTAVPLPQMTATTALPAPSMEMSRQADGPKVLFSRSTPAPQPPDTGVRLASADTPVPLPASIGGSTPLPVVAAPPPLPAPINKLDTPPLPTPAGVTTDLPPLPKPVGYTADPPPAPPVTLTKVDPLPKPAAFVDQSATKAVPLGKTEDTGFKELPPVTIGDNKRNATSLPTPSGMTLPAPSVVPITDVPSIPLPGVESKPEAKPLQSPSMTTADTVPLPSPPNIAPVSVPVKPLNEKPTLPDLPTPAGVKSSAPTPAAFVSLESKPTEPVVPAAPPAITEAKFDIDVDVIRVRAGDTFATVSEKVYGTPKYAAALRAFNQNTDIGRLREVMAPPLHVLRKQQPAMREAEPTVIPAGVRGPVMDAPVQSESTENVDWGTPGRRRSSVRFEKYTTPKEGMTARDVARAVYADENEWGKLSGPRGTKLRADDPLPRGTEVTVPREELPWK
jgi:hypothetical protein